MPNRKRTTSSMNLDNSFRSNAPRLLFPGAKRQLIEPEVARRYVSRFAGIAPTSRYVQEQRRFRDHHSALIAALEYFNPLSAMADAGFSGVIFKAGKHYAFTGSVICSGARSIEFIPAITRNRVTAFWRTTSLRHPSARYFADHETRLATLYHRPFYLATSVEMLKVFNPGDRLLSPELTQRMLGYPAEGYALGRLVHDAQGNLLRITTRLHAEHLLELEEGVRGDF